MNPVAPIESSDGDLVRRAQSGDRKAFGELLERYMRRAYYSALGLVGSAEDARDLSQEAFVRAFRARQTIDPERPFFAWLYQIIRRLCFNHTRDRRTRLRGIDAAQNWLVDQAETRHSGANPDQALETGEARRRVRLRREVAPRREGRADTEQQAHPGRGRDMGLRRLHRPWRDPGGTARLG